MAVAQEDGRPSSWTATPEAAASAVVDALRRLVDIIRLSMSSF